MGKTLAAVAVFLGLYALYDTQSPGSPVRVKASEIGADAVIAISISYHTISTGPGLNMMMVAVTGTAVRRGAARTA